MEKIFGLIGATVSHSFSKSYFDEKFFREGLRDYHYELFPLTKIQDIEKLLKENKSLSGLNVTLPYKEQVIKYLNEIDPKAKEIGAVNVIKIEKGKLKGYNTDSDAFFETIEKWLPKDKNFKALILGSGGSSKAVQQALSKLGISFKVVSRDKASGDYAYEEINANANEIEASNLIVNTTPLGMHPNESAMPPLSTEHITRDHYVYDLIYNPARTQFLQKAEIRGATIKNGLEMLHVQAEKSWTIWNK
ncbi:MAG TPA: shikimate dehydrogenase [Cyclobacteriaceae bacterium]|nr:shikimate dehydrogenase [Cyclobacteriaceae bacterium]HMV09763.1 shikimate dehydrogenase [Cyclobacteriaceae bacterium]HMV88790.1 shikimate dehydrogenase [Cyclobacteriaceae bacterium]HMX02316.1 shikimate dehydrogenase [Cyclobacteriaceae bacterium]HMX52208.1 shikimate dehydrogenase [Cyclobacteriaceae bacterium]